MPEPQPFLSRDLLSPVAALRPRWAWICLALGLPWLLTPLSCGSSGSGCLGLVLALCFWTAVLALGPAMLRWSWRKLLFKVSRRLWLILLLTTLLPALTLTVFFVSLGWLGLGAQVSRSVQATLKLQERAVQDAGLEGEDRSVLKTLGLLGVASVAHTAELPPGLRPGLPCLVFEPGQGLSLRLAQLARPGFRLITLPMGQLRGNDRDLWGGRASFRLDWSKAAPLPDPNQHKPLQLEGAEAFSGTAPVATWTQGELDSGPGLLRAFPLPPVTLRAVAWGSGRPMSLTLTPETSMKELFMGYGFGHGNLSARAAMAIFVLTVLVLILAGIQLVALFMGLALSRNLGKAVDGLFQGVARLSGGDFSARIRRGGWDQIAHLSQAFNTMAHRLQQAAAEHSERLRLVEELKVAREVQMRLLPDVTCLAPSVQAVVLPAREVAGDYFDVCKLVDGRLAFMIADVSGKGTSAAFYAAETKGVLAALDKHALDPREVATRINSIWCANHPRNRFMTLIYGTFHPATGCFALIRAGHPQPLLTRANGAVERLNPRGLGIGMTDAPFQEAMDICTGTLEPGDRLVCYTDGLSEARNPEGELVGEHRLAQLLAVPGTDPKPSILAAVAEFAQGEALDDDLTLLILQR